VTDAASNTSFKLDVVICHVIAPDMTVNNETAWIAPCDLHLRKESGIRLASG
jgi:hypothetical protein